MRTIQSKIGLTVLVTSAALVLLLGILLSNKIEQYFHDRLLNQLQTESGAVYALLRESALRGQRSPGGVRSSEPLPDRVADLRALAVARSVRITLIAGDGTVLFESDMPDSLAHTIENHLTRPEIVIAAARGIGSNRRVSRTTGEDLLYVARSVDPAPFETTALRDLRYVRIAVSLQEVHRMVGDIRSNIIIVGGIVLVLILIGAHVLVRRVSRPIAEIGEIVREIKAGNLDRKLPVRSNDEIGRLAELINELTGKLRADIDQLQKLQRVRTEFLANVSHELRTPIFSVRGFLETLLNGAIDDTRVNRQFIEKAYVQAERLDTLLSDLIEISRIESGEMKMSFRYFEAVGFMKQLAEEFTAAAQKKRQTIRVEADGEEVNVFGDKERLRQAVGNIVDNAIKYSPEQASITIRMTQQPGSVLISISDTGPGIEAIHLPRIFERFYRVDKNRSREVGGTGLGLAIVKHIIEAHHSKITVSSEVGKGTTFSFDLKS